MIDFGAPIGTAYERMVGNLFRPFDVGKWFALGFSAFLASLLDGGNSFNYSNSQRVDDHEAREGLRWFISMGLDFWLLVAVAILFLIVVFVVVLNWLGARGQFMLVENVRSNRDLVVQPWKEHAERANSFFVVFGAVALIWVVLLGMVVLAGLAWAWPYLQSESFPGVAAVLPWILFVVAMVLLWIPVSIYLFFLKEWGVPIAIALGCGVVEANRRVWRLMVSRPLDAIVYAIVRLAMGFIFLIMTVVAGCLTCCIGFLPYLSQVLTLPLWVYRVHFTLDCLRQFSPEYDLYPPAEGPVAPVS